MKYDFYQFFMFTNRNWPILQYIHIFQFSSFTILIFVDFSHILEDNIKNQKYISIKLFIFCHFNRSKKKEYRLVVFTGSFDQNLITIDPSTTALKF